MAASGRQYNSLKNLFAPVADDILFLCENGGIIYKDGKVLYFSLNQFNNALSVKETLTNYAAKHIAFDSVSFDYYDSIYYPNYTFLQLLGPGGEADRIGYVRTAYDEAHTAYTVVVNERTGEIWVEPGTWKY